MCLKHTEFTITLLITLIIFNFIKKFQHRFAGFLAFAGLFQGHSPMSGARPQWQEQPLHMLQRGWTRCAGADK